MTKTPPSMRTLFGQGPQASAPLDGIDTDTGGGFLAVNENPVGTAISVARRAEQSGR